ncbi:MAG: gamma carbonic anhydrase family protein [Candidatus Rokubacteria bacterium GWC2_70_16]|nr:MAG: gamma carbonic anhydrase family protein [Candidatus Rokubacteria bacterium GWA2_70_23]OGK88413.1 MAG: gamma carbonic anhydrase family protein [Candidatus Rokubacteria bacterium GWC2_70_16]
MIHAYRGVVPKVHPSVFVAHSADVIGDVELAEESGVWFTSVVRGDVNFIRIGRGSNIQDGTVIHVNRRGTPTIVEEYVTVGHGARLHGCHVKSHCLIGIGAVVLDGAVIEEECLVAAGAVVSPGTKAPRGSVLMGAPARVTRQVTDADLDLIHRSARNYVALAAEYKAMQGA